MPKLLDEVRACLCVRHYSFQTEKAYAYWSKRFSLCHHKRHPKEMGAPEVTARRSHLATAIGHLDTNYRARE